MTLKRKLVITFGALGFMTLLVCTVTLWAMIQWQSTEQDLREHYTRSLLLQEVRASTFRASLEIGEAINTDDPDAREEFDDALAPAQASFEEWSNLAHNDEERREVEEVRDAYEVAVRGAYEAFDLVDAGRQDAAQELFDTQIEDEDFPNFQAAAQEAEEADRERRDEIRANVEDARRTAYVMLAISAFGALSLVMLLAAYLASDLFTPLKDIRNAIRDARRGDHDTRLPEERSDEIGEINHEFNEMMVAISRRDEDRSGIVDNGPEQRDWVEMPTRVTLHRMISEMQRDVNRLEDGANGGSRELASNLRELSHAVSRLTEFSYPLDLNLTRVDIRATVYGVVQRFNGELIDRSVSLEVEISPDLRHVMVDGMKLREALSELLKNALRALPERGGRIGVRARISGGNAPNLLIEVADDGSGADRSLIDQAFERDAEERYSGLTLVKAVVEQHGGEFTVDSEAGEGTYARIAIPMRD